MRSSEPSFKSTIKEMLRQITADDRFPDFKLFQAAVRDLCGAYPKEQKYLLSIDKTWYTICCRCAAQGTEDQINAEAASRYLQSELMTEQKWAEYISHCLIYAMAEVKDKPEERRYGPKNGVDSFDSLQTELLMTAELTVACSAFDDEDPQTENLFPDVLDLNYASAISAFEEDD